MTPMTPTPVGPSGRGSWRLSPAIMARYFQRRFAMRAAERAAFPGNGDDASGNTIGLESLVCLYARIALGAAFLSAVASRFGLWNGTFGLDSFARFMRYTAEVNAFMPASTIPFLAWAATIAESTLGIALIAGIQVRRAALGSALLLALFGTSMAVSLGFKSPLDYSVFSASAGALLLAQSELRRSVEPATTTNTQD